MQGIDPVDQAADAKAATQAALAAQRLEKTVDGLFDDWERVYLSAIKTAAHSPALPMHLTSS